MPHGLQHLKQRLPLLEYLRRRNWTAHPIGSHQEFVGLCPLHAENRPSFYVNAAKDVMDQYGKTIDDLRSRMALYNSKQEHTL